MAAAVPTASGSGAPAFVAQWPVRLLLLALAAVRWTASIVAIPLAPVLWRDHMLGLVLLRPTKDVFLAAGFAIRQHHLGWIETYAAAVPIAVLGVWLFYALGRSFSDELAQHRELPGVAGRLLPATRIHDLTHTLDEKGSKVVFFGRLAVFPSSLVAAAAGVSGMDPRRFLIADGLGALASITMVLLVGYGLGEAYEQGATWLTIVGGLVAFGLLVAFGRWLRSDRQR